MANPRIDDLRKRLEKDPGSRLFAQLAEELRKDGDLSEAILVSRQGLRQHPNYPSARMTLGRALYDTGDFAAARVEFEQVLKGAPDNILASRLLGECLEHLGDRGAAIARLKATLALAPGDKQVVSRLEELQRADRGPAGPADAVADAGEDGTATPIKLVDVDGEMELERPGERHAAPPPPREREAASVAAVYAAPPDPEPRVGERPPTAAPRALEPPPIPVAAVEEEFELERPYEAPVGSRAPAPSVRSAPLTAFDATPSTPPRPDEPQALTPGGEAALISPTLAELYFNQGFTDKAIEVYRELSRRGSPDPRFEARLRELEAIQRAAEVDAAMPSRYAPPASGPGPAIEVEGLEVEPDPEPETETEGAQGGGPATARAGVAGPPRAAVLESADMPPSPYPAGAGGTPGAAGGAAALSVPGTQAEKVQRTIARLEAFLAAVKKD